VAVGSSSLAREAPYRLSFLNKACAHVESPPIFPSMPLFSLIYEHPKSNQENINQLNGSITCNEIEAAIKRFSKKRKVQDVMYSPLNSMRPLKKKHFSKYSMK
jgi:hypothetical protein